MSLHNEDRELQIRLAELQADVQINLTICFGILGLSIAVVVGLQQTYFTLPPEKNLVKVYINIVILVMGLVCIYFFSSYFKKAVDARNKMKELRKEFMW